MKHKLFKIMFPILLCMVLTSIFTTVVFAAQYIYYDGGLRNPTVEVEDRLSYKIFRDCIDKWNRTNTPVEITQVPGSGHSYVISGQWDDTWYECFILGKHTARNGVAGISPPRREFQKC